MEIRNEKGSILITVLIVFSFMAVMGVCLLALIDVLVIETDKNIGRTQALYLAEAGVAHSISEIKNGLGGNIPYRQVIIPYPVGVYTEGIYSAAAPPGKRVVTGTGTSFNDITKEVEISYRF